MSRYVLSVDAGTTSVRAMLFGHDREAIAQSQGRLRQMYPGPGMVEHDAGEIWRVCRDSILDCLSRPGVDPDGCVAVGIANQRETVVVWDRVTGEPVCNAIAWQDRRTGPLCEAIRGMGGEEVHRRTGLVVDPYFSATKLRWILDNVDGARGSAESGRLLFGTVETWLIWNLTGGRVHATDYSNASRTMMFDINRLCWDAGIVDGLGIPSRMLPEPVPCRGPRGHLDRGMFGTDAPICASMGDQQSALFGQACFGKGDVKVTFGTGGFVLMNIGSEPRLSPGGLLTTVAWDSGPGAVYALEGSIYIAGAAVQWLRDDMEVVEEAADTEQMALSVEDTAGCYVVPAFVGLGAPYWDEDARGIVMGLTRATGRRHVVRAALESMAFQANDVISAMRDDSGVEVRSVKVDGGASANGFLCQFLADIAGVEVRRPACIESTAFGAACMAGLAAGFWDSEEELSRGWRADRVFRPAMSETERRSRTAGWDRAVRCARMWSASEDSVL